ncbi:MAG: secondary thiamine-phosphate synthase enzyme YjbQ [Chloroflexi bacterium]|nr:secondary thiamine-phosphate synthase enzyme YjbQ [Chloroflexota bacterium]
MANATALRTVNMSAVNGAVPANAFRHVHDELAYRTEEGPSFRDITEEVREIVHQSGVGFGQVSVFSQHTTAAIILQEHEPLLLNDLRDRLIAWAPPEIYYRHNDFDIRTVNMHENEPENGHSHVQHMMLGTSETIPVLSGELHIGEYQSIFLVELDESRDRRVSVTVLGVTGE